MQTGDHAPLEPLGAVIVTPRISGRLVDEGRKLMKTRVFYTSETVKSGCWSSLPRGLRFRHHAISAA